MAIFGGYFRFGGRHVGFPTSGYVVGWRKQFPWDGDHENMGIAVGISPLSSLRAEIWQIPVWRPPSWISWEPAIFQMSTIENLILLIFLKKMMYYSISHHQCAHGITFPHGLYILYIGYNSRPITFTWLFHVNMLYWYMVWYNSHCYINQFSCRSSASVL